MWDNSAVFKKLPKGINRRKGESSPHLVTLVRKLKASKKRTISKKTERLFSSN
jgi:hypothetical protein